MHRHKNLPHTPPTWVDPSREIWFITICCEPRGHNQLATPNVGPGLLESVGFRSELGHWHPYLFVLMPDHCHGLMAFNLDSSMKQTITDWKRWTARNLGVGWQPDFFDHRLRKEEGFEEKARYIRQNPVRAGLVSEADEWPYVWNAPEGFSGICR